MRKGKIVVIEGTTASGKSDLAVELALKLDGEILSADSRQVFRGLDIGSGKITKEEMRGVPHYGLDVVEPGEFFSVAQYQRLAYGWADDILARGKTPILCGGTGLYLDAVAEGYLLSDKVPDLQYRAELERLSTDELYRKLCDALPDPPPVDPRNRNRVMRMLEKLHDGDSAVPQKSPRYEALRLAVTYEREILKRRIDDRLDCRLAAGMEEEIRGLLQDGVDARFLVSLGLEYRFVTQYVLREIESFSEMREALSHAIKRFALRQMTWFRRHRDAHWLPMDARPLEAAEALSCAFLAGERVPQGTEPTEKEEEKTV